MPQLNRNAAAPGRQRELTLSPSAVDSLKAELTTSGAFSLLGWKRRRPEFAAIEDGLWLMNAYMELKSAGFCVALVSAGSDPFEINEPFQDVELSPCSDR